MKFLVLFLTLSFVFASATSTTGKIKSSKKDLTKTSSTKKKTTRKLSKIARDIKKTEESIRNLENRLDSLEIDELKSEKDLKSFQKELINIDNRLEKMSSRLENEEKNFQLLVAKQLSIVFAMKQAYALTKESVIRYEFDKVYEAQHNKLLIKKKLEIKKIEKSQKSNLYLKNKTKQNIVNINQKQRKYRLQKAQKEKLYKKLSQDEEKYRRKLNKIEEKQNFIRSTLFKLNILRKKEIDNSKKEAQRRRKAMLLARQRKERIRKEKSLAKQKVLEAKRALIEAETEQEIREAELASLEAEKNKNRVYNKINVKQNNPSYKIPPLYKYRGIKTMSPLKNAKVIKVFGTYLDPRYKMKIFNESITLKSKITNAKVRTVLNGRVIFASDSTMMGKVVVIAHSHKIFTIYAGLSKIAPTIRLKAKIKKGYVIGKVYQKLIFQARKNSKLLNPLRLIRI